MPPPWNDVVPVPSGYDGKWSGTATFKDAEVGPNCVWAPNIVLIVGARGTHAKLGVSYSATNPRRSPQTACPGDSSVREYAVRTSTSGSLAFRDGAGNDWSLTRARREMTGSVTPSAPASQGSIFGGEVYLAQELEGQDPRAPYRLFILTLFFLVGIGMLNAFASITRRLGRTT